jgi:hypothetical protein
MDYLIYIEVKIVDLFNKLIKIVNIKIRWKFSKFVAFSTGIRIKEAQINSTVTSHFLFNKGEIQGYYSVWSYYC